MRATRRAPPQVQKPELFKAAVDIVSLNVTVVDDQNHYLTDITEQEFSVFEDGAKQELTFFNRTQPADRAVAAHRHQRQHGKPAADRAGGRDRLRAQAAAAGPRAGRRLRQPRRDHPGLHQRRRRAREGDSRRRRAGGSTSLHNAIYISLKELAKIKAKSQDEIRRRAIVVLSDGEDTSSLVSYEEVLDLAKRSETAIYAIGLQPRDATQSKGFREAEFVLRQFAQETGGRAFFPSRAEDLKDVYGQIADELSSQYSIGYASKNGRRDGGWRRIAVQVARPNAVARTKRGYYAPAAH